MKKSTKNRFRLPRFETRFHRIRITPPELVVYLWGLLRFFVFLWLGFVIFLLLLWNPRRERGARNVTSHVSGGRLTVLIFLSFFCVLLGSRIQNPPHGV